MRRKGVCHIQDPKVVNLKFSFMKFLMILLSSFFSSCFSEDALFINPKNVIEIDITSRTDDKLLVTLKDEKSIKSLLTGCVNGAKSEPIKFLMNYRMLIKEKDTIYSLLISGSSLNLHGKTYNSTCNVEQSIKEYLLAK